LWGCIPPCVFNSPRAFDQTLCNVAGATAITLSATGSGLGWVLNTLPAHGNFGATLPPNLTYTPDGGFTGLDQFTFSVTDSSGCTSNVATVRISVGNVVPTAQDIVGSVVSGVTTNVLMSGSDPDGCPGPLTFQIVTPPVNGSLGTVTGRSVPYTSNVGFIGTDTFTYRTSDSLATSPIATATLTVTVDPTPRKLVLTLQNRVTTSYIHYNLILIAFREDVPVGQEGPYLSFGYVHYPVGTSIGCYSFARDLFLYYHQNGRFSTDITNTGSPLLSAIAPAPSTSTPRADSFFNSREIPVPSVILFHDPVSNVPMPFNAGRNATTINPTLSSITGCGTCTSCAQAGWYYVLSGDIPFGLNPACSIGRNAAASGRYYRVPAEYQNTCCFDCISSSGLVPITDLVTAHWLHNTGVSSGGPLGPGNPGDVRCYEYYLNGVVTYAFTTLGNTSGPSFPPSLVWEVKTRQGIIIHPFFQ
jgi:hypothetical protein